MSFEKGFPIPLGNRDSWGSLNHGMPIPQENGIGHRNGIELVGYGDPRMAQRRPMPMDNGAFYNMVSWNTATESTISQRNGISQSSNWIPVTSEQQINERINPAPVEMQETQLETKNWHDLIGMYTDLLQEKPVNQPPPVAHDNGNQSWVASITNRNLTQTPNLVPYQNHTSNQPSYNTSVSSMLGGQPTQRFTSTSVLNNGHNPNDGFYRPGSPPRFKPDHIIESFPFAPITPGNQIKHMNGQRVQEKVTVSDETSACAENENANHAVSMKDAESLYNELLQTIENSPPSAVSTTQKDCIVSEDKDEQASDLQKTSGQKTPARRKKHWPKVIREGKPKRAPKNPKNGTPSEIRVKRKYVKRKGVNNPNENTNEKVTISDETSACAEKENANHAVSMKDAENLYNELLQTIENSPPSAVSTTQKDCIVSEDKDEQASDLQKTPGQKTPARRKKHRPKVIREGKPKRTPKNPKNGTPGEIRVKRKYVKRKGVNNPNENTPMETVQERKNVRRKGVNGEKTPVEGVQKRKYVRKKGVDHSESQAQSTVDDTPPKSCKKQLDFDLVNMTQDEGRDNKISQPDITAPSTPFVKASHHGLNMLARNMITSLKQDRVNENGVTEDDTPPKSCRKQLNFDLENMTRDEGHDDKTSQPNIIVSGTPLVKASYHCLNVLARNMATSIKQDRVVNENGITKDVFQTDMRLINVQHTPQTFKSEGMVSIDERRGIKRQSCEQLSYNANAMNSLLMYQKMLLGVANRGYNSNHLGTILLENRKKMKMQSEFLDNSRQMQGAYGNGSAMGLLNSSTGRIDPSCKVITTGGNGGSHRFWRPMAATHYLLKRQLSNGLPPNMMRSIPGRLQNYSRSTMISWNKPSPIPTKGAFRNAITTYPKFGPNSYNQRFNGLREMLQQHRSNSLKSYQKPAKAVRGRPRKQKVEDPVDIITRGLERLQIYDGNRVQQNKLVLYKGSEAMIPFVPIKKRNPRPKVDLDPESERLWNLLMGNEESNGAEKQDNDKEKWWENERRVFSGRTDSFIARMHLVQGDRRFSRWKGSVVDSVIGVFLTQNVSDHLSSSAFMSLAAKFPVKSTTANNTCCQDGITKCHERVTTFSNLPENNHIRISEEEVIPSQESFDSSTIQTVDECRSSAGSNSEDHSFNDDVATNMHHPPEEPACNIQVPETNDVSLNSPSSQFQTGVTPGLPSSNSEVTDAYHTSNVTNPRNEIPKFQTPSQSQHNLPSSHPSQPLNTTMFGGIPKISVEDRASVVNKQNCVEDTVTEANSKKQDASHAPLSEPGPNKPKEKKVTPEDERKSKIDWDSLRKQALNGEKKERSKDANDTIDYEALRRASVNEISDVIKERGMNNLLADRMKDFLNRLVRDHGSIDLEWLRDAPPDKAKDYLLSFRGLGLKSVECVRLLTLHHLAFPVDTNVGRIAVRLGWVPLQPLPESLQLHLLEMYPVLESIQKYLWPRLCKLDQLTLYELHYQMITFGKVFCTKSKPNCNACPMRAECRHFASAFASARLALPGPEEKRIVTSDAPVTADPIPPPVVIRPMPLLPAENESNRSAEISGNYCEPIIEEPATPEPETNELSISDIEDQYYEDSDEIPSIKLNMEEFTTNLQNIMQDSNDLSKALVALTPKAASIPTPKLKDVSRLRTEHLVYELPDSHQLLEGLEKREPDDPSPYLLAIWTPGETANSAQAPTTDCLAQKSGQLCDQTTCFSCNSVKEANSQVVRGTILIPCRTAMRGSFPLNGTYFQVNEMFADHASSLNPIAVPRTWIWNLPRRKVYFGTSVSTIFKGLTTEGIQYCFWKGFVCVRGFDRINRAPRPLMARLHFPASKLIAQKTKANK